MIYVTSDLHGYPVAKFKRLLEKAKFSDEDYCFVLGDVIDRGPESIGLLQWMMTRQNVELIMGNHEAMFLSCSFLFAAITDESLNNLGKKDMAALGTWVANGGGETIKELSGCNTETVLQIIGYLREAPLYDSVHVNNRDFLLVHGGLGAFNPDKKIGDYSAHELIWTRPKLTEKYLDDVITVLGHTPTHFYGEKYRGRALKTPTWIDIDTGAGHGGSPMLLRLDDMKEFYI